MLRAAFRLARRVIRYVVAVAGLEFAAALLWPAPKMEEHDPSGEVGTGRPLHLVVLGDSTVAAPGLPSVDTNWTRQVAARMADRYRVKITSLAVSGSKVRDLLDGQLSQAVKLRPDVVLVAVGANDVFRFVPKESFRRDLDRLVGRLVDVAPVVMLSGVGDLGTIPRFLPPLDRFYKERARRFDGVHQSVAEKYGVAKVHQWGEAAEVFRTGKDVFAADLFHASEVGHAVWADVAWETLKPVLEARFPTTDHPTGG